MNVTLDSNKDGSIENNHQMLKNQFLKPTATDYIRINMQCNRELTPTSESELREIILKKRKLRSMTQKKTKNLPVIYVERKDINLISVPPKINRKVRK